MLLFKGEGGRPLIEEGLLQKGAYVITLTYINESFLKLTINLLIHYGTMI